MTQIASALPVDSTIRVPRERDVVMTVEFRDGDDQPVDLTGDTLACAVYETRGGVKKFDALLASAVPASGDAQLTFTVANLTDGASGNTVTRWYYVIDRTHAGKKTAWFGGSFEIHPVASE